MSVLTDPGLALAAPQRNTKLALTLQINPTSVNEGETATGTVSHNGSTTSDVTVTLQSSNSDEVTVPATVTIPTGSQSLQFDINALSDANTEGNQTYTITASATNYRSSSASLTVVDVSPTTPTAGYTLVDLGTLGDDGGWSFVKRMNNRGDVVGSSADSTWGSAPFVSLCHTGAGERVMFDVNDFIAPNDPTATTNLVLWDAADINDSRQVAGYGYHYNYLTDGSINVINGFVYRLQLPEDLTQYGTLEFLHEIVPGVQGRAWAINNAGDVYLDLSTLNDATSTFYLRKEGPNELIEVPPDANGNRLFASAISERNDAGYVTAVGGGSSPALRFSTATGITEEILPAYVDRRSGGRAGVYDVDGQGRIVGWTSVNRDDTAAARYSDVDGWQTLGSIATTKWKDGWATATSDDGEWVVGASSTGDFPTHHAFVYTDQLGMRDLEKLIGNKGNLTGSNLYPADVNRDGIISGPIYDGGGGDGLRAFVLLAILTGFRVLGVFTASIAPR